MDSLDTGIYTITSPSGRKYVGSAVSFRARWRLHLIELRAGRHHCKPLQRAYAKYGETGLIFERLLVCAREHLIAFEQRAIDVYGFTTLYNVNPVAGSRLGARSTPEHCARISAAQRGKKLSPEHIEKLRTAARPPITDAAREKLRAANLGRKMSPATIAKRRESRSSSPYPFVVFDKTRNKYIARPLIKGRPRNIGRFDTAVQADAAVRLFLQIETG